MGKVIGGTECKQGLTDLIEAVNAPGIAGQSGLLLLASLFDVVHLGDQLLQGSVREDSRGRPTLNMPLYSER